MGVGWRVSFDGLVSTQSRHPQLVNLSALVNPTVNAAPEIRAAGRFNPLPGRSPSESLSESNMVHGTGHNGACHLPC